MALVHLLSIPKDVTACAELAEQDNRLVELVVHQFDEGHWIFDKCDFPDSLKDATREKRQKV